MTEGHKRIYICTFHIPGMICVKFGVLRLHIMLLFIHEFHENWGRNSCKFFMGVNADKCICVPGTHRKLFS